MTITTHGGTEAPRYFATLTVITLPDSTKKYKIISRQNLAGVATPPNNKGEFRGSIEISSPEVFWGPSKYLIVVEQ